ARARRPPAQAPARRAARGLRAHRHEGGLRRRRVRRVHRAGRRRAGRLVPGPRRPGRGRPGRDDRGPGRHAPAPEDDPRRGRRPVRDLHAGRRARRARSGREPAPPDAGPDPRGARRKLVPVHRLRSDPSRRARGARRAPPGSLARRAAIERAQIDARGNPQGDPRAEAGGDARGEARGEARGDARGEARGNTRGHPMRSATRDCTLHRPRTLDQALRVLGAEPSTVPLAGCTDVYVALQFGQRAGTRYMDLTLLRSLARITTRGDVLVIGALATYTELQRSRLVRAPLPMLGDAARCAGGCGAWSPRGGSWAACRPRPAARWAAPWQTARPPATRCRCSPRWTPRWC